jgi:RNase P subunit RPR2
MKAIFCEKCSRYVRGATNRHNCNRWKVFTQEFGKNKEKKEKIILVCRDCGNIKGFEKA